MPPLPQPEDRFPSSNRERMETGSGRPSSTSTSSDASKKNRAIDEPELDSALQLLVERALYITGATGAALALPQDDEMVCRASAGTSAPAVGMRLQVLSGLTGESIARRQLLRCDNAETDPRVNLEACRALGIASIVVLPLFRQGGEVRGLIELFSDHPYAFEERDLVALERMADLTATALDLADERESSAPTAPALPRSEPPKALESYPAATARSERAAPPPEIVEPSTVDRVSLDRATFDRATFDRAIVRPGELDTGSRAAAASMASSSGTAVPETMRRMQKCSACGFPVSEGRTICLDCEKKEKREAKRSEISKPEQELKSSSRESSSRESSFRESSYGESLPRSLTPAPEEFVPPFLANAALVKESWWSNHINLLALFVLILGILVAIVVFR